MLRPTIRTVIPLPTTTWTWNPLHPRPYQPLELTFGVEEQSDDVVAKGGKVANLKELRFGADGGVSRAAFGGRRISVLLAAGDKAGVSKARFYRTPIARAPDKKLQDLRNESGM